MSTKISIILTFLAFALNQCSAQQPDYIIVNKDGLSLGEYAKSLKMNEALLREFNPHLSSGKIFSGDTIFLKRKKNATTPESAIKPDSLTHLGDSSKFNISEIGESHLLKSAIFKNKHYVVCEVDPAHYTIELFNKVEETSETHSLKTIADAKKQELIFVMNAGMFQEDLSPLGLFVSDGKILHPVNTGKNGKGNFYELDPNGIFLLDKKQKPFVITTEQYLSKKYNESLATQSGPMLVTNGVFNNHFKKESKNLNIRNGVGVNATGKVVFVISEDKVNFYEFSELFRDHLGCSNALYLDGFLSQYFSPELNNKSKTEYQLATFIAVCHPAKSNSKKPQKKHKHNKSNP